MDPGEFREKFRPHVAEELFDYAMNIARAKQLDPLTAMRRSWRQRKYKKRRAIKVQKDASYYEGVYVAGYSTQNPAQRTP